MKKGIKKISLFLIFAYLLVLFSTSIPFFRNTNNRTYATGNPYIISVESSSKCLTGSTYEVEIKSNETVNEDIVVRVRTFNMSAVDGIDYTGFDKEVTIKKGTDSVKVGGSLKTVRYVVDDSYYVTFAVEIYEVVSGNAEISADNVCEIKINTTDSNRHYSTSGGKFSEYNTIDHHVWPHDNIKITSKTDTTYTVTLGDNTHNVKYINTGLATYYACGRAWLDEHWWDSENTPIYLGLYQMYSNGSTGKRMYWCGFYDIDEAYITFASKHGGDERTAVDESYITDWPDSFVTNTYIHWGENINVRWWQFPSGKAGYKVYQNSSMTRWVEDMLMFWCIRDITPPKITGWYVDKNLGHDGSPLRVSVRFGEPVHLGSGTKPSIEVTLSGTGSFRNKTVSFDYVGGAGTDTLYFDYYPEGNGTISGLSVKGIKNATNIYDYGSNLSGNNNAAPDYSSDAVLRSYGCRPIDLGSDLSCKYDNTIPTLDYESPTVDKMAKKHAVNVSVSGVELENVRYIWSEKNKLKKNEITNTTTEKSFTLIKDTGTGTFYLHLLAQSRYSQETYRYEVVGPFYLDNSPPDIKFTSDTITGDSHIKNIRFRLTDDKGIQNVIMYYSEQQPNTPGAVIKKVLIYGDIYDEELKDDIEVFDSETLEVTYENNFLTFVLNAEKHFGLSSDNVVGQDEDEQGESVGTSSAKEYADYYIGFVATDILDNETEPIYLDSVVNFDVRNTFETSITVNDTPVADAAVFSVDRAYVIDVTDGDATLKFTRTGASDDFGLTSVIRYEGNRRIPITEQLDAYFTLTNNNVNDCFVHNDRYDSFSCTTKETGYYEFIFYAESEGNLITYSTTNKIYITNGSTSALPYNYETIYEGLGLNYKTSVFMLGNGRYFYRTSSGMGALANTYYNNSENPLIFSSKDKAIEYIMTMEYLDMYAVKLTLSDVNSLKNGALNIAAGESAIPEVGQVWIRYKAINWNYSANQRDWAYYYYGDKDATTTIDVNKISQNLLRSINDITNLIISKGQNAWLTAIDGLDENGVPYIDPVRIPNTETFTQTKNGNNINITYVHDEDMFYDKLSSNTSVNMASWYEFVFRTPTKIFYAEYDETKDYTDMNSYLDSFQRLTSNSINQFVDNGTYVIREIDDQGMRDYLLFVDKIAPEIIIQYVTLDDNLVNSERVDINADGAIYHTKEFSIKQFTDNADIYSHVDIFDIRTTKKLYKSFDLTEFKTSDEFKTGCGLEKPGVYQVDVYDRAGNHFSIYVSVAAYELEFNVISIKDDRLIISLVNRIIEDIVEFKVTLDGEVILEDFASMAELIGATHGIIFYDSGYYEFEATDAFGYTISINVELVRVNPYENVLWFIRNEESYEALDPEAISEFSRNIYYITTDDKLTFVLENPSIYSYEFGGNVTYEANEGDDGNLYVDVTSSEKWSVKIYYIRYPDTYVSYNRIGQNVIAPAAIGIRTEDGYTDANGVAQPDADGKIILYVYAGSEIANDITVSVKTRNMSAIYELGDYQAYENTITLTRDNPEYKIVIQTNPSGFTIYDEKASKYFTRTFEIFIYDIVGNGEKGSDSVLECSVQGTTELTVQTKSNTKYFQEYLNGYKESMTGMSLDTKSSTSSSSKASEIYDEIRYYSIDPSWHASYVETGLADVYTTVGFNLSGDDSSDATNINFKLTDTLNDSQIFKVALNELDDNDENKVLLGSTYSDARVKGSEEYNANSAIKIDSQRGNAPAAKYYKISENSYGRLKFEVTEGSYKYWVPGTQYSPGYYAYAWPKRYVMNLYGYSVVVDSTAPEAIGWYLNHDVIKSGDTLRISVRFSEPVYIKGKNPTVTAKINGTTTIISFEYAGGAGTDTLYFEFNPEVYENEFNISSIVIQGFNNKDSIHDFAYNVSGENNTIGTMTPPSYQSFDFTCSVDSRTPMIESNFIPSEKIIKSVSVPITISRVSPGGLVQYSWTNDVEIPTNFANSQDIITSNQNFYLQSDDISGTYYLHIKVSSVYGKVTIKSFGPFLFDSQPPVIKELFVEEASKPLMERQVSFVISDYPLGLASSGLNKIYMVYSTYGEEDEDLVVKTIYNSEAEVNQLNIDMNGKVSFLLHYYDLGLDIEQQKDFNLGFYASDNLGNEISFTNYVFYNGNVCFDSRSMIDVNVSSDDDYEIFKADGTSVFDSSYGVKLNFEFLRYADEYDIHEFYIAGNLIDSSDYENYFTYIITANGITVDIVPEAVGYFSFKLKATSGEDQNKSTQYTNNFNFYFTIGVNTSETNNYVAIQDGTLLINKIYYLGDTKFYYHDGMGVRTTNYNDSNLLQAFSSKEKAYEYVYFNELLDLYTFEIPSAAVATSLNNGGGSYRKAEADSKRVAEIGQVWIRYKRSTWDNSTSTDAWVYYYYGNSTDLFSSALPVSLQTALAQVTNTIISKGKYEYLTSYEGLDSNYSPTLNKKQIHFNDEVATATMSGSVYKTAVRFEGDFEIYNSRVTPSGYEECSVITSYRFNFGPFTKLYYARDYGRLASASEYMELPENYTFANVNIESGVYWLREIDENGMRDFRVYIDKTAPSLNVTYTNSSGATNTITVDSSVDGIVINGQNLYLINIGTEEVDTMAYVAVFRKNGVLFAVYRIEDFAKGRIEIPEGQYYLEVCDRSGNMYKVVIRLNTTLMVCKVIGEENKFVRVTCNRETSDISVYEIYLDGELVESNYAANMTFYGAGLYTIRIEDWYGNVFTYEYELKRTLPIIEWSYEDGDSYIAYDGSQSCVNFVKTSDKEYIITTNRKLQFAYLTANEYEFEFTDKNLSYSKQDFNGKTRVKINDDTNWTIKIYYSKYPNIYVIYRCTLDTTPPTISVDARQELYAFNDENQVKFANQSATETSDETFTPDTIKFAINKILSRNVNNNSTIFANLVTVKFVDNSICNHVEVYLDGELLNEYYNGDGVEDITLSRFGTYRIVATDVLGNSNIFNFRNQRPTSFNFVVDGEDVEPKASPNSFLIDENGNELNYPVDKYGNSYALVGYKENSDIAFLITKEDVKTYARFEVNNGLVSRVNYKLLRLGDGETEDVSYEYQKVLSAVLDTTNLQLSLNAEENRFRIADAKELGINIYAQVDENRNILFYVESPKDSEVTVEARCSYDTSSQPYYVKVILSGKLPGVSLVTINGDNERQIEESDESQIIYLSGKFYVSRKDFEKENISSVKIAYSKTNEFDNYTTIYENREYTKIEFEEEGFYSIIVENIYGGKSSYISILSNTLNVVLKSTLKDGKEYQYSTEYAEKVKTNGNIEIYVYTSKIEVEVNLNGIKSTETVLAVDGFCLIQYDEIGDYKLKITDNFGNVVSYEFEIDSRNIEFEDDYLYGFNEKALRRNDYYTNYKLSLNSDLLIDNDISFVSVGYGTDEYVLFDLIAEEKHEIDEELLLNCIGNSGNGIYTILIRNSYGDSEIREVNYRETPTLSISRMIRTSNVPETINFVQGFNKVYSNYSITFETLSSRFEVKVDGSRVDLPLTLTFPSDKDDIGEYIQNVTYIDEYGFEYLFEVNLIRKKLEIDFSKTIDVVEIDAIKMTRNKIVLEFEDGITCNYSLNGMDPLPYEQNQILTSDGTYRFYLTDVAGNISTATIKKDTLTEYAFTYAGSDRRVERGSIINSGRVQFSAVNRDSVKLKTILLNGEPYKDVSVTGFSEMGKWEFVIEDNIGNSAYFYFYIINHSVSKFDYTTPYTFKITEIILDSGDGLPISYLNNVLQFENNSQMSFVDSGKYTVKATSSATTAVLSFSIVVDKNPPKVELVGVNDGETTTNNVEVKGCEVGDTVEIYKNGELYQTVHIVSTSSSVPVISTKGDYRIVVTNEAGNSVEFSFHRQYTANGATTVFLLVVLITLSVGIFVGLVSRKRLKV